MSDLQRQIRELRARVITLPTDDRRRSGAKHAITDALSACTYAERRLQDTEKIMGIEVLEGSIAIVPEGGVIIREPETLADESLRLTLEWS